MDIQLSLLVLLRHRVRITVKDVSRISTGRPKMGSMVVQSCETFVVLVRDAPPFPRTLIIYSCFGRSDWVSNIDPHNIKSARRLLIVHGCSVTIMFVSRVKPGKSW